VSEVSIVGLDIAKHVFHAHGAGERGRAIFSKRISRGKLLHFFAAQPSYTVARSFYELATPGPSPIASEALEHIAALYAVEKKSVAAALMNVAPSAQQKCQPLVNALELWLRAKLGLIGLKSNTVERSIRPIALTRKNALFAGSDGGAEHWATIASLIETCKLNDVDPLA
jgi:transposase